MGQNDLERQIILVLIDFYKWLLIMITGKEELDQKKMRKQCEPSREANPSKKQ